jgi:hypothetical protein
MPVRKDNREERQAQADRVIERATRQERAAPAPAPHGDRSGSGDRGEEHAHAGPARTPPVRDARVTV